LATAIAIKAWCSTAPRTVREGPRVDGPRSRTRRHTRRAASVPKVSRSRTWTSIDPTGPVPAYRRPLIPVDSTISSRVRSRPQAMRAAATAVPGGRVEAAPIAIRATRPTAHPSSAVANSANAVTPPERNPKSIADPTTTRAAVRSCDRLPTPDTVKNATAATSSPSRGVVRPPSGRALVNAASMAPRCPSRTNCCNTNASRAPTPAATTASKSCQDRERATRPTPSTISRTRSPTPPAQPNSCSRARGNAPPAPTRSCSRPLAVPTATVPSPTARTSVTRAKRRATTSAGRRTLPLGCGSTTTTPAGATGAGGVWVIGSYCRDRPILGQSHEGGAPSSGSAWGERGFRGSLVGDCPHLVHTLWAK